MKRLLLISTCLFIATPVFAQQTGMQSPAYSECSALANSNPTQALAKADAWLKIDSGIAAQHCRAMALYGLRRFAEAADTLIAVHGLISIDNIALRGYVARQASSALMGANKADEALALLTKQINDISTLRTDNGVAAGVTSELLVERSRVNSNFGKLDDAAKDLDHAVSLTPTNESVLMERANVFEKLGDIPLAKNDLKSILVINSSNSAARNMLTRLNGGVPVVYHAPTPQALTSSYSPKAVSEAPTAKKPVKRAAKKKRIKKPAPAQVKAEPAITSEPAPSAAAASTEPTPKTVEAKPVAMPAPAAAPALAAPSAVKPAMPAMPTLPSASAAPSAPALPAASASMPTLPALPPLPAKQ